MRKHFLSLVLLSVACLASAVDNDAVLLTIDGKPSYASEFVYIYNKNNNESAVEQMTMDEYLERFINYKLKVHEAKQLGLDTTKSFIQELAGYRKQIVPPYMTDSAKEHELVVQAYDRKKEDIAVRHIAIKCPVNASAADTLAAYNAIMDARQRVTVGVERKQGRKILPAVPEDFAAVARMVSQDPSVSENDGYLGWIIPFRYVLSFEEAAYNTPVGQVSNVFRTPFGYHILKVEQRVPHKEIHAAHIMKMTPRNDNPVATDSIAKVAKEKIDSIYLDVTAGKVPFSIEAIAKSDDRGSAGSGGDLNWFGRGQMVPEFEETAFALTDSGQISKPIKSAYGWHVVQKLGERGLQPFEQLQPELLRNVKRDERYKYVEKSFVGKLKRKYNLVEYTDNLNVFKDLATKCNIDDSLFYESAKDLNATLITFGGQVRTQADFLTYLLANNKSNLSIADKIIDEKYEKFVNYELTAYEESQLENEYDDLRNLMAEYHDGILLFDVSLSNVWDKASQDTAGLRAYFNANKDHYTFDQPRFKGRIVACRDMDTYRAAKAIVKNANPDSVSSYLVKRLNYDSIPSVSYELGLWSEGQNKAVDKYGFKLKNAQYEPQPEFPYVFVVGKKIKLPTEYSDVRGLVTADYQNYLEQEWIKELRSKYVVKVNQEVFEQIKNQK